VIPRREIFVFIDAGVCSTDETRRCGAVADTAAATGLAVGTFDLESDETLDTGVGVAIDVRFTTGGGPIEPSIRFDIPATGVALFTRTLLPSAGALKAETGVSTVDSLRDLLVVLLASDITDEGRSCTVGVPKTDESRRTILAGTGVLPPVPRTPIFLLICK